jgi:hypothetical protein
MAQETFQVTVTTKGKNPIRWFQDINDRIHFEFQQRLVELGEEAAEKMKEIIRTNATRKPTTGRLENSIDSEIISDVAGVTIGIGKISKLPIYWEVVNDGGYIPPPNIGAFDSGAPDKSLLGKGTEQWHRTGGVEQIYGFEQLYFLNPKTPIKAMNYIQLTEQDLVDHIQKEINNLYKELDRI